MPVWVGPGHTQLTVTPVEPSEAMAFSRASIVNAGLIFFAATILLTAVFGRFFCGWGCHVLALQDLCSWLLARVGIRPRPFRSRLLVFMPLGAALFMFVLPSLTRLWIGAEIPDTIQSVTVAKRARRTSIAARASIAMIRRTSSRSTGTDRATDRSAPSPGKGGD